MFLHTGTRQFVLFLAVGGLNTAVGYGLFVLLLHAGLHYSFASLLATVAGIGFNFKTTGRIVFRSRDNRLLLRFVAVYAATYLLNLLGLRLLTASGMRAAWAGALLLLPIALLTFFLQRGLVFPRKRRNVSSGSGHEK